MEIHRISVAWLRRKGDEEMVQLDLGQIYLFSHMME